MKNLRITVAAIIFANLMFVPGETSAMGFGMKEIGQIGMKCFAGAADSIKTLAYIPITGVGTLVKAVSKSGKGIAQFIMKNTPEQQLKMINPYLLAKNFINDAKVAARNQVVKTGKAYELELQLSRNLKALKARGMEMKPEMLERSHREIADLGMLPLKTLIDKTVTFPKEAFGFFVAIGALQVKDLMILNPENPIAWAQHIESQGDPVGQLGFLAFMQANGLSSEVMKTIFTTPQLARYIPYLGMSIGTVASHIVGDVGHTFVGCRSQQLQGKSEAEKENCYLRAFHAFTSYATKEKAYELMPSLMAMLAATMLAGVVENCASAVAAAAAGKIIEIGAIRMAAVVIGGTLGGIVALAITVAFELVMYVAKIDLFMFIQEKITPAFTFAWKNIREGWDLAAIDRKLLSQIRDRKLSNWTTRSSPQCYNPTGQDPATIEGLNSPNPKTNQPLLFPPQNVNQNRVARVEFKTAPLTNINNMNILADPKDCSSELAWTLNDFKTKMTAWRQMNMADINNAHAMWEEALKSYVNSYQATKRFYGDLLDRLSKVKNPNAKGEDEILNFIAPYNGIKIEGIDYLNDPKSGAVLLTNPIQAARNQIDFLVTWLMKQQGKVPVAITSKQIYNVEGGEYYEMIADLEHSFILQAINQIYNLNETMTTEFLYYATYIQTTAKAFAAPPEILLMAATLKRSVNNFKDHNSQKNIHQLRLWAMNKVVAGVSRLNHHCDGESQLFSKQGRQLFKAIRSELGAPTPLMNAGAPYMENFSKYSGVSADFQTTFYTSVSVGHMPNNIGKGEGSIYTPTFADYILTSAILGPIPGKNPLVYEATGFRPRFLPPKVTPPDSLTFTSGSDATVSPSMELQRWQEISGNRITTISVDAARGESERKFNSLYEYALTTIRERFVVKKHDSLTDEEIITHNFNDWWDKNVEPEFIKTWPKFESSYDKIVENLIAKFKNDKPRYAKEYFKLLLGADDDDQQTSEDGNYMDSSVNMGPIANGLLDAVAQERNLYLLVLGEMIKDIFSGKPGLQNNEVIAAEAMPQFNSKADFSNIHKNGPADKQASLLELLRYNNSLDFLNLMKGGGHQDIVASLATKVSPWSKNLRSQNLIRDAFERISMKLRNLELKRPQNSVDAGLNQKSLRDAVITNKEIEKDVMLIKDRLQELATFFNGLKQDDVGQLSEYQVAVFNLCLSSLKELAVEVATMGQVANAVNYKEIYADKTNPQLQKGQKTDQGLTTRGQMSGLGQ